MSYFDRRSFPTRDNFSNADIEGSQPFSYISKFQRRDPLRVDDIQGAAPQGIVGYTGATKNKIRRNSPELVYGPTKTQAKDQWLDPRKIQYKNIVFNSSTMNFGREAEVMRKSNSKFSLNKTRLVSNSMVDFKPHEILNPSPKKIPTLAPSQTFDRVNINKSMDNGNGSMKNMKQVKFKSHLATTGGNIMNESTSGYRKTPIKATIGGMGGKPQFREPLIGAPQPFGPSKAGGIRAGYQNTKFILPDDKFKLMNRKQRHMSSLGQHLSHPESVNRSYL
ncbi:unnamed protein product [Moneuplotes crassus]|uniref:Uncharacterized protein n=1 Tax=Euplotes crassus TaxID=5936 RepID=A0AAD2D258_EUPCR|nr:unnamed protein product [Moneuplotes crassus]